MDYKQLKYFLRIYNDKNISKASKNLFVSQQGLSKIIKKMEREFDVPLFLRNHSGVEPTLFGDIIQRHVENILDEYNEMFNELYYARGKKGGRLYVTMNLGTIALLTPKPFLLFSETYKDIDFVFHEHRDTNCENLLIEEKADLGFAIAPVNTQKFNSVPFYTFCGTVLVNKKHPLATRREVTLEDLRNEKLMFCGAPSYHAFVNACTNAGFEPDVILSTCDINTSLMYVQSNIGISPCLLHASRNSSFPDDITLLPFQHDYKWDICMVTKRERVLSDTTRLFIDFILWYFRKTENSSSVDSPF